ncbi:hypothetical protein [Polyangium spumosum]|uniref:PE-PGRS family protein n=1 Tax=Polyangium spumosum TaxID=889282 RepID=A0A6N7PZI7_9BACT|nr:hypothetical protein [Polyangium spumosum]MRG97279.1 hypothetical protein [Polyangium spumosum]
MRIGRAWILPLVIAGLSTFGVACGTGTNPGTPGGTGGAGAGGMGGAGGVGGEGGVGGGTGGAGGGTGGGTAGSGGMNGCGSAADCPGADSECGVRTCNAGVCGMLALKQEGTVLQSQKYGDCTRAVCGAMGEVVEVEDTNDRYDDGNPCTLDTCTGGTTLHINQDAGFACGMNGKCDAAGQCVRCNVGGPSNECPSGNICVASKNYKDIETLDVAINKCVPASCKDGVKNNNESDIDCGGNTCAPCNVDKVCNGPLDCMEAACDTATKTCAAPTCFDSSLNGNETFPDYGGPDCPPNFVTGAACKGPSDCLHGVCQGAKCAAPTCFDATLNGTETGVDCGGSCAATCFTP